MADSTKKFASKFKPARPAPPPPPALSAPVGASPATSYGALASMPADLSSSSSLSSRHSMFAPPSIPIAPLTAKRFSTDVHDRAHPAPPKRFKSTVAPVSDHVPYKSPLERDAASSSRRKSLDRREISSEVDSLNLGLDSKLPSDPLKSVRKAPPSFLPVSLPCLSSPRKSSPNTQSSNNPDLLSKSIDQLKSMLASNLRYDAIFSQIMMDHQKSKAEDIIQVSRLVSSIDDRTNAIKLRIALLEDLDQPQSVLPTPFPISFEQGTSSDPIHRHARGSPPPPSMSVSDSSNSTLDTIAATNIASNAPEDAPMSIDSPEIIDLDDLHDMSSRTLVVGEPDDAYFDKFDPLPDDLGFLDADKSHVPPPPAMLSSYSSSSSLALAPPPTPGGRIDHTASPYYREVVSILKNTFKLSAFRTNQLECIIATLDGKDVFYLAPTGGGKSLCFQLPALCITGKTQGTTFVISPLISLITDQVAALRKKGVPAFPLTSAAEENEVRQAMRMMRSNIEEKPKLVYTTPERLQKSDSLKDVVDQLYTEKQLARFVIDEAHVIGSWGRDFRASYAELNVLRRNWPDVPIMALTGSANKDAIEDIKHNLAMRNPICLAQSFNRPNLHYSVRKKPALKKDLVQQIAGFIKTHHPNDTGIVYALSRAESEEMAQKLREEWGIEARHYHAGIENGERKINQDDWMAGRCKVIVATIAFGMGIDKPDVRFVIHATLSKDMDGYYQETGRAGRDGRSSDCVLFYTYSDAVKIEKMLRNPNSNDSTRDKPSDAEIERQVSKLQGVVAYCCNESDCRRVLILRHFDEEFKPEDCHNQCDNCHRPGTLIQQDFTAVTRQVIQLLEEMMTVNSRGVTPVQLKDTLKGKNGRTVQLYKGLPLYACCKALGNPTVERIFNHLSSEGVLSMYRQSSSSGYSNTYVQLGSAAADYVDGDKRLVLSWKEREEDNAAKALAKKPASTRTSPRKRAKQPDPQPKSSYLNLYDDIEDADDADPSELEVLKDVIDNIDVSEPTTSRIAPVSTSTSSRSRFIAGATDRCTSVQGTPATTAGPEDEPAARLEVLRAARTDIANRFEKCAEAILQDDTLQLLALTDPKDEEEFRNIMMDCEEPGEVHDKWHSYGSLFLVALQDLRSRARKAFDTARMRRDFAFNG